MTDPSSTVYLISCVGKKLTTPTRAQGLYVSSWFLKVRDYIGTTRGPWFILSAEYGLVSPDRVVAPYDRTLNTMRKPDRQAWAVRVRDQMEHSLPVTDRIVVLAGRRYREFLMDYLRQRARTVEVPMEGLGIGKQLHFLSEALNHAHL